MRYAPAERLLGLALHLAGTRVGLTLDEMAAALGVGRRTAERLRDSLQAMFPQMECWDDEARIRRWRLPGSALAGVINIRPEALAAVETAARECEMNGEADRAALLWEASATLRAVMRPDALRQAEPDIAALMEAEGIAMRPGSRLADRHVDTLSESGFAPGHRESVCCCKPTESQPAEIAQLQFCSVS